MPRWCLPQTAATGIEYNLDDAGFVNTWGGSGPVPNTAGVTVDIIEASGASNNLTVTLGTAGAEPGLAVQHVQRQLRRQPDRGTRVDRQSGHRRLDRHEYRHLQLQRDDVQLTRRHQSVEHRHPVGRASRSREAASATPTMPWGRRPASR